MGSRFGFHSGNFHAKNFIAGTVIISGATSLQAITFPKHRWFSKNPKVLVEQELTNAYADPSVVSGVTATNAPKAYSIPFSGTLVVSGVTVNGFTLALFNVGPSGQTIYQGFGISGTGTTIIGATTCSGALINYYAFDYKSKRI